MTQEELDSLVLEEGDSALPNDEEREDEEKETGNSSHNIDSAHYRVDGDNKWPPPPPTEEHQVINQLDDVTRDSELKMTQVFDQLEIISTASGSIDSCIRELSKYVASQERMLSSLTANFPKIKTFSTALEQTRNASEFLKKIENSSADCADASMRAMDTMQYQDIHRQKIERVVNVIRALSRYMNSLFEGKIDDRSRVGSATYIVGDNDEEIVDDDDIESLISSFGQKK